MNSIVNKTNLFHQESNEMKLPRYPKDPLDAVIVAFLWAEWFVKQCFIIPWTAYEKWDQDQFNKSLEQNPPND